MKVYCIKDYKVDIDLTELDIPKFESVVCIKGNTYDVEKIDPSIGLDYPSTSYILYDITGENGTFTTISEDEFHKHFILGEANIRDFKINEIIK